MKLFWCASMIAALLVGAKFLGLSSKPQMTAAWLRHFFCRVKNRRNRVAVETSNNSPPRVVEAATLGWTP